MSWDYVNIGSVCTLIDGDRGKNYPKKSDFHGEGDCLFLDAGNVTKDGFDFSSCSYITAEKDEVLRAGKLSRNDVVLTTRGTLGNVGWYSEAVPFPSVRINSGMLILRSGQEILPGYLYYCLRSAYFQSLINGVRSGSAQPQLPAKTLKQMEIPLPPLRNQQHIASILMAYDNLIENSRRQIALLEEAAQRLYREWFVDLRFPGHENVEIIDELPANWSKSSLTNCADVIRGRSYTSSEIEGDEGVALVNLKNLRSFGGWNDGAEKTYSGAFKDEQHVKAGDIIMGVTDMTKERRLVGHVALVPDLGRDAIISMDLVRLAPHQMEALYLYSVLRFSGIAENIALLANGTNVLHLKPQILSSVSIDEPPIELQADYARHIAPMVDEINLATRTIAGLSEARDRLLPKLMSDEIEVEG